MSQRHCWRLRTLVRSVFKKRRFLRQESHVSRNRFLGWCAIVTLMVASLIGCFFFTTVGFVGLGITASAAFVFGLSHIDHPTYRDSVVSRARSLGFTHTEARVIGYGPWREMWRIDDEHAALVRQRIADAKNRRADEDLQRLLRDATNG
jgi:hypothetical protein